MTMTDAEFEAYAEAIADDDIRALRAEAATAGDLEQVAMCDEALAGDAYARRDCVTLILHTRQLL
jgi:hypothetical protein